MLPQNATSPPVPTHSTLPPGVAEFLTSLFQNGTLPLPSAGQTPVPPASSTPPPGIPPPAEGRSFTRPGRGEGGVLVQKQKVSKQITTSAIKRKALVDSDVETLPPSTSGSVTKSAGTRPSAKRIKTTKSSGRRSTRPTPPEPSQGPIQPTPVPDFSVHPEQSQSPISTPTPPRPVLPVSRTVRRRAITQPPRSSLADSLPDNNGECVAGTQDNGMEDRSDHSSSEAETPIPMSKPGTPTPVNPMIPFTGLPLNLLQAFLAHAGGPALATLQIQPPAAVPQPQSGHVKMSRGVKGYPDGWRQVLNSAKDIVRSSILLTDPFPGPAQARVSVNECFHEALTNECENGTVLEPGFSWGEGMLLVVLGEISTCRGDLKKLARILVGSDSGLFPSSGDINQPFKDQTAPEIRVIASRSSKKPDKSHPFWDPSHVRSSVANRLVDFAFLNNPPTAIGELLASPILEALCRSFYEERKWQRALMVHINGDDEWIASVTVTMVSFAATSYYNALEEWRSGSLVQMPFEAGEYTKTYIAIRSYITALLDDDTAADQIAGRFKLWAEESVFIQELLGEAGGDE